MKSLKEYIEEAVAISVGDMEAKSTYATPGNTTGIGDVKPPTLEEPGSDVFGITRKARRNKTKTAKN